MAKASLILDTGTKSKSSRTGLYPVALKVYHKGSGTIRSGVHTSLEGWDVKHGKLRKSASANKGQNCEEINSGLNEKLYRAKKVISEIGESVNSIKTDRLIYHIKSVLDERPGSEIKKKVSNEISLSKWGNVLIHRKKSANRPGTATWYKDGIDAIKKFNGHNDIMLYDITVTFLKNFEAYHLMKNNSMNTISIYPRAIRAIYNAAIDEDPFTPIKNSFRYYRIPSGSRTKKRAIAKEKLMRLRNLSYEKETVLWHAKNYTLIMFNCMGMNFTDLVRLKVGHIADGHIYYGRSKTDDPFCIKMGDELKEIISYYSKGKEPEDYLFPTNYDGSSGHFQKYKSQRRRMNERLRIIAGDAGIEKKPTTYSIRHSWATTAKYMGISTEIISEALGHRSLKTTEVYLKSFTNETLDKANEMVVA